MRTRSKHRPGRLAWVLLLLLGGGISGAQTAPPGAGKLGGTAPVLPSRPVPGPTPAPAPAQAPKTPPPPLAAPSAPSPTKSTPSAPSLSDSLPPEQAVLTECKLKLPPGKKFKWDLRGETDLAQLVQWASAVLCHPVIVPQNLRQQKVTIYAPNAISMQEAQRLFFASLASMGLTVQPEGPKGREVYTIIEARRAHEVSIPLIGPEGSMPANQAYVTKVIKLRNVGTDEISATLNGLKSTDGNIVAFAPAGTLIITDTAENIRRMEQVIRLVDVQPLGTERIWVVKLQNTSANEMAAMLDKIFQPKGAPGPGKQMPRVNLAAPAVPGGPVAVAPVVEGARPTSEGPTMGGITVSQIIPEERSNTLIIVATEKAYQHILGLIRRLDQVGGPLDSAADRVHVYFLANGNAEDMANTLSGLGVGISKGKGSTATAGRPGAAPAPGTPGGTGSLFESEVKVAPDKATNSLIIVASGKDYLTLRDLVRKLDIPRRQVFIEATILEVSLDKMRKLGLALHGGGTIDIAGNKSLLFGGLEQPGAGGRPGEVNSILFSPLALTGLAAGLRGPNIPEAAQILGLGAGQSVPAFGVFVQALQNNNDVNVVSMPHVLTSDNEKATIKVGRNLPFPGSLGGFPAMPGGVPGQTGTTAGFGLGFGTSVQRQDVALTLDVTPHVNDSDFVRLEVDNEISDVASENFNGLGPATDKRTVKTVVVVRDQQPVVLGGLIRDRIAESVDKIPILGDIPILGYLFKFSRKTILKQNLLIILTPYVIKDPQDLRRIFEQKIRERKDFLDRYSAFTDKRSYEPNIDYRRKRGLLEEINRTAVEAEIEVRELEAAERALAGQALEGPVEPVVPPPRPPPPAESRPAEEPPRGEAAP